MRQRFLLCLLLFLFLPATLLAAEISFAPAREDFGVGHNPTSVAIGDLNADGKLDLAVANSYDSNVSIMLGNGDGTFQVAVNYSVVTTSPYVAIGDLNGDGKPDLVVAHSVLLGNGDGTFQTAIDYGVSSNYVAIGDLNGDGKLDLVLATSSVTILLGNGDGTFRAAVNYSVGTNLGFVAIGDVNGDSKPDLAVTSIIGSANGVLVLLGNGNGTFAAAVSYAAGSTPKSVAIGDLNADGKADLVVANYYSNDVSILRGNGNGTFQAAVNCGVESNPRSVAIADFNGDGKPDLAVTNYNVTILLGNGDGTFQAPVNYIVGRGPQSVAIGDLNGDDKLDLAVVNNSSKTSLSILRGSGDGTFAVAVSYSVGTSPQSVAIADLNGDGKLDLTVANSGSNTVSVLRGNGDGTFAVAVNYSVGTSPRSVAIGDLNGDGKPDLAVANSDSYNVSILLGNGNGTFTASVNYYVGTFPSFVAIGDVNNDGKLDLAVTNAGSSNVSILRGNGNGTFAATVNYALYSQTSPYSVAIGDLNGDGRLDLTVAGSSSFYPLSVLLGNGDGTFQSAVNFIGIQGTLDTVAIGDLNADGKPDLVVTNGTYDKVLILRGNGDGTFVAAVSYDVGTTPYSVVISDLNGDGKPDLSVANFNNNNVSILRGNGDGTFQAAVSYGAGIGSVAVAVGDFNGDGKPDLVVANPTSNNVSILMNAVDLPVWTPSYPQIDTIASTLAEVLVNTARDGTAYAVCLPSGAAAPTSLQVRAGQDAAGTVLPTNLTGTRALLANSTATLSCASLSPSTSYDIYTVAEDSEGSLQPLPTKQTVTTDLLLYNVGTAVVGSNGSLSCNSPVTPGSTSLCNASPALGYYLATISGCGSGTQNGNRYTTGSIDADCAVTATFVPKIPVTLLAPNGGETLLDGTTTEISWAAATDAVYYDLSFSLDGGTSWTFIRRVQGVTSTSWKLPDVNGDQNSCVVRVIARDAALKELNRDLSNASFTLIDRVPVVLLSPNGGETLLDLSTISVSWSPAFEAVSYDLSYSLNNGTSWTFVKRVSGTSTSWTLPDVSGDQSNCLVRIIAKDGTLKALNQDVSNATFTIADRTLAAVLMPNGGEVYTELNAINFSWSPATGATYYDLAYSLNGGTSWIFIKRVTGATSTNWKLPEVAADQSNCLVRVTARDSGLVFINRDQSNAVFTLRAN